MGNLFTELKRLAGIKEYPNVTIDEVGFKFNGNKIIATRFFDEKHMFPRTIIMCHGGFQYLPLADYPGAAYFASLGFVVFCIKYELEGIEKCDLMADVREVYDTSQFLKQTYKSLKDISLVGVSRGTAPAGHAARMSPAVFNKVALVAGPTYIPTLRPVTVDGIKKGSAVTPATLEKIIKYLDFYGDEVKSSLLYYVPTFAIPIGLFYGDLDVICPNSPKESDIKFRQGAYMDEMLRLRKTPNPKNFYQSYPYGHSLMSKLDVQQEIARWLFLK